jgi:hypothetical protein
MVRTGREFESPRSLPPVMGSEQQKHLLFFAQALA